MGFKFCVGHPWEFLGVCKAMIDIEIFPDFIVVDGMEGGTGAAPLEFADHLGMPLREGLVFVRNALIGINARGRVRIGCSGKIVNAFDMARAMALGADWCNAGRGFMFALGCIQSLSCHTDRCPTGVATQDKARVRALVVEDKMERVRRYHNSMLHALAELTAAAGLEHPQDFRPEHFSRRVSAHETMTFAELYPALERGELIAGAHDKRWRGWWDMARAIRLRPPPLGRSKPDWRDRFRPLIGKGGRLATPPVPHHRAGSVAALSYEQVGALPPSTGFIMRVTLHLTRVFSTSGACGRATALDKPIDKTGESGELARAVFAL